jgi:hypothetical protein
VNEKTVIALASSFLLSQLNFYAEFIALLLNSFLRLLFGPSLKGGVYGLFVWPSQLFFGFWCLGGASYMGFLAPTTFLVACLLGLFHGLCLFFFSLFYPNETFSLIVKVLTFNSMRLWVQTWASAYVHMCMELFMYTCEYYYFKNKNDTWL